MSSEVPPIQPHTASKAQGVDICGDTGGDKLFIIRSDLNCYLRCTINLDLPPNNPHKAQKYEIFPLHPACSGGEHYLKNQDGFIIIKKNRFIIVNDLTTPWDRSLQSYPLQDALQDGDNYLHDGQHYIMIKRIDFHKAESLEEHPNGISTGVISPSFRKWPVFLWC